MRQRYLFALAAIALLAGLLIFWPKSESAKGKHSPGEAKPTTSSPATARHALEARASLAGRVLDSEGQGLAGATLMLSPGGDEAPSIALHDAITQSADDGSYSFSELPAGAYRVSASAPGWLPAQTSVELAAGQEQRELNLQLEAGGFAVQGVVHDLLGGTVGSASVEFMPTGAAGTRTRIATQANEEGAYNLSVANGSYLAWASHPDYVPQTKMIVVSNAAQAIDFELAPGAEVEGQVLRASDDAPVPFATVSYASETGWSLFDTSRGSGWVLADGSGHFVIKGLRSGSLTLQARADNAVSGEPTRVAVGIADHTGEVLLYLSDALRVQGHVVDADTHEPIAGMQVVANSDTDSVSARERSAEDGSFVIEGLAAKSYRFEASGRGYLPRIFAERIEVHDKLEDLLIEVERGRMVEGRVEPPQVADVSVDISSVQGFSSNAMQRTQSGEDGSFRLGPFSPASFGLQAESAEGARGGVAITLADKDLRDIVIHLEESASVSGRVVDASGAALGDVEVHLRRSGDSKTSIVVNGRDMLSKSAHTSPDGSFRVVGLDQGEYELRVQDAQGEPLKWAEGKATSEPKKLQLLKTEHKEQLILRVETRDARIEGVVRGPDGQPAPDVWVSASASRPMGMLDGLGPAGLPPAARGEHEDAKEPSGSRMEVSMVIREDEQDGGAPGLDLGSARELPPVLTNDQGEFVITGLRRGSYDLRAEGLKGSARAFVKEAKTGEKVNIALEALTRIEGQVRRGEEGVGNFIIELQGDKSQRRKEVRSKDGSFTLHRVDPGHYTIVARNHEGQAEASLEVSAGEVTKVTLQMETLTQVQGQIIDSKGAPLRGVLVIAAPVQKGGGMEMMVDDSTLPTGADGRFAIGVRPGSYMLIALDPASGPIASRAFEVKGDTQRVDLGTIQQTPGGGLPSMGGDESDEAENSP